MKLPARTYFMVLIIAIAALVALIIILMPGAPVKQCESLQECIRVANVYGHYEAAYYDSYSSPGGTATTMRTYEISNDQLVRCVNCSVIYTSGYGNTSAECPGGGNDCSSIMKQTDAIDMVRDMNVSREFRLGTRNCFQGGVLSEESFDAIVCFDETNRVVNYAEQGKRPFYRFNVAGYETDLSFS